MRGSTPIAWTASATWSAMSARVSASGSMLMLASAKNFTESLSTIMYIPVATLTPGLRPRIWRAGRMVSGKVSLSPDTRPSACPFFTIIIPK